MAKNSKNVLQPPKLKADHSRNPFDVSYLNRFTAPLGALLPCGSWRLNPDDYVEIQNDCQVVSPQLSRPAFVRLKQHVDYFFVPYVQMWAMFDNLITGQSRTISSAILDLYSYQQTPDVANVPSHVPMLAPDGLYKILQDLSSKSDVLGFNCYDNAVRLLDLLGYGNMLDFNIDSGTSMTDNDFANYPNVNLFNLLAYQKIYYDFYSNRRYESFLIKSCNIDNLNNDNPIGSQDVTSSMYGWFDLHYRWMRKDYFTQTQPSNLPDGSLIGFEGLVDPTVSNQYTFGVPGSSTTGTGTISSSNGTPYQGMNVTSGNIPRVESIRFAFAYDKLLRRMRQAGQNFDKQMLAQYGISPYDGRHGDVFYIGGFTNRVSLDTVTDMTASALGNMGAQINAYSAQRAPLKYHVKEHGILMCVQSFSIDNDYQSNRIDRSNVAFGRFDWFNNAFDNLGQQVLLKCELELNEASKVLSSPRKVLGFVPRYSEYKTHVDEVHGLFNRFLPANISEWVATYQRHYLNRDKSLGMDDLLISPQYFDQVANTSYEENQTGDPFICNMYHRLKKISNMSVYGEQF